MDIIGAVERQAVEDARLAVGLVISGFKRAKEIIQGHRDTPVAGEPGKFWREPTWPWLSGRGVVLYDVSARSADPQPDEPDVDNVIYLEFPNDEAV